MKINEGFADRTIRTVSGLIILSALFFLPLSSWMVAVGLVIGLVALLTGIFGFCPIYAALNFDSRGKHPE